MKTTCEILDAVKAHRGLASDYSLAPVLGVTRSAVSRYRQGKDFFSDSTAIRAALLLEVDPAVVIACVHAERAKAAPEKALWESIAARLGGAAAALLLGFGGVTAPPPAVASQFDNKADGIHIMRRRRREIARMALVDVFTGWGLQNSTFAG